MATSLRQKLGDFGEQVAATHLTRLGMVVLAQKWRCAQGEIDLVLRENEELVFVEVRTRRSEEAGQAEESVGIRKQQRLVALAYSYLAAHTIPETAPWRIDVVAINIDRRGRVAHFAHIRHAVEG